MWTIIEVEISGRGRLLGDTTSTSGRLGLPAEAFIVFLMLSLFRRISAPENASLYDIR